MKRHELKCWPEPFAALWNNKKWFEFRFDDRGFKVGDTLWIREWDGKAHTGRSLDRSVTYILAGGFGLPMRYVIMSLAGLDGPGETK